MPSYTLVILKDRHVEAVLGIHADTNEAARHESLAAFAQYDGAVRFELWFQDQRIFEGQKEGA